MDYIGCLGSNGQHSQIIPFRVKFIVVTRYILLHTFTAFQTTFSLCTFFSSHLANNNHGSLSLKPFQFQTVRLRPGAVGASVSTADGPDQEKYPSLQRTADPRAMGRNWKMNTVVKYSQYADKNANKYATENIALAFITLVFSYHYFNMS